MKIKFNLYEAEDVADINDLLNELTNDKFILEDLSSDFNQEEFFEMYNYFINNGPNLSMLFTKFLSNKDELNRLLNSDVLTSYEVELTNALNKSNGDVNNWEADLDLLSKNVTCIYDGRSVTLKELQSIIDRQKSNEEV